MKKTLLAAVLVAAGSALATVSAVPANAAGPAWRHRLRWRRVTRRRVPCLLP